MKGRKVMLGSIIALGLLAGSTVGAAAQEEGSVAPVEVTGADVEGSCPGGPSTMDGLIEKNRGYVCQHTWSMSDPRLEGTFTRAWNLDSYRDGTRLDFGYATGRLETADGAWQMRPGLRGGIAGEPDPSDVVELFVFDGEDDYEGLAAVVLKVNRGMASRLTLPGSTATSSTPTTRRRTTSRVNDKARVGGWDIGQDHEELGVRARRPLTPDPAASASRRRPADARPTSTPPAPH